jgi:hypothetical protein
MCWGTALEGNAGLMVHVLGTVGCLSLSSELLFGFLLVMWLLPLMCTLIICLSQANVVALPLTLQNCEPNNLFLYKVLQSQVFCFSNEKQTTTLFCES